jgi:nitric oxide reductase NorQ protein
MLTTKSTYYREVGGEVDVFEKCFENQLPLLIKGPTGCGKSQFVLFMSEKLQRPIIKVSCNEDTTAADLLGRFVIQNMNTVWQDGPVTRAVRTGAILYLDEIAEAREDVIVALHPLTDHRREIYLDRTNETLHAADPFFCVASYNPGYQRGLKELKPSTRQRFVSLTLKYPDPKIESEILNTVTKLELAQASKLVGLATKIRSITQLGLKETVSTRLLVYASTLIKSGMNPRQACRVAIAEPLTDDLKILESLIDLIALHF